MWAQIKLIKVKSSPECQVSVQTQVVDLLLVLVWRATAGSVQGLSMAPWLGMGRAQEKKCSIRDLNKSHNRGSLMYGKCFPSWA